jgi:hypothetical protein
MYIVKANGMTVKLCRSLTEAKRMARYYSGSIFRYSKGKLPQTAMVRYSDSQRVKQEIYREIYSENNHGYHFTKGRW